VTLVDRSACGQRRPCRSGPLPPARGGRTAGFTLVELLIAVGLAAWLSAGAWAWVWAVTDVGDGVVDATEAQTALAYARRVIMADARAAEGLAADGVNDDAHVTLRVPVDYRPDGRVEICWNRRRDTLWRVASRCHLAGNVEWFDVDYVDGDGSSVVSGGTVPSERLDEVSGLVVSLRIRARGGVVEGRWPVWFSGGLP